MENMGSFLNRFKQNDKLPIPIVSPAFGQPSAEMIDEYGLTHRTAFYCFLFMVNGSTSHNVDLKQFDINDNEFLFILPNFYAFSPGQQELKFMEMARKVVVDTTLNFAENSFNGVTWRTIRHIAPSMLLQEVAASGYSTSRKKEPLLPGKSDLLTN